MTFYGVFTFKSARKFLWPLRVMEKSSLNIPVTFHSLKQNIFQSFKQIFVETRREHDTSMEKDEPYNISLLFTPDLYPLKN